MSFVKVFDDGVVVELGVVDVDEDGFDGWFVFDEDVVDGFWYFGGWMLMWGVVVVRWMKVLLIVLILMSG